MANSHDRGDTFPLDRAVRVTSTSSALPPTNIPLTNAPAFNATNYDRQIAVCYGLGEYQSVTSSNGSVYVGWGDDRNQLTEPVNALNPISGRHTPNRTCSRRRSRCNSLSVLTASFAERVVRPEGRVFVGRTSRSAASVTRRNAAPCPSTGPRPVPTGVALLAAGRNTTRRGRHGEARHGMKPGAQCINFRRSVHPPTDIRQR